MCCVVLCCVVLICMEIMNRMDVIKTESSNTTSTTSNISDANSNTKEGVKEYRQEYFSFVRVHCKYDCDCDCEYEPNRHGIFEQAKQTTPFRPTVVSQLCPTPQIVSYPFIARLSLAFHLSSRLFNSYSCIALRPFMHCIEFIALLLQYKYSRVGFSSGSTPLLNSVSFIECTLTNSLNSK